MMDEIKSAAKETVAYEIILFGHVFQNNANHASTVVI